MNKRRRMVIVLIGGLAICQTSTYFCRAHKMMPVAGLKSLSDFGLVRSRKFVVLTKDAWSPDSSPPLTAPQRAALCDVFKRYGAIVYNSAEDVPENGKVFVSVTTNDARSYELLKNRIDLPSGYLESCRKDIEPGRKLVGYTQGMSFKWKLDRRGLFWMKSTSTHWISGTGAEHRSDLFIWFLGRWLRVWNYQHAMA